MLSIAKRGLAAITSFLGSSFQLYPHGVGVVGAGRANFDHEFYHQNKAMAD